MKTQILILIIISVLFATEKPKEMSIKAFLNEKPIDSKVFNVEPVGDVHYGTISLVKITAIFEAMKSKVELKNKTFTIQNNYLDTLIIDVKNINDAKFRRVRDENEVPIPESMVKYLSKYHIYLINDEFYISISTVRYLLNGALKESDSSVTLFTPDFSRNDIPGTLKECYFALDTIMKQDDITAIKSSILSDLGQYHMTLGMWIRNKWIYPSTDRVAKSFLENDIRHPDDISFFIIKGYYYYLIGEEKSLEELLLEK